MLTEPTEVESKRTLDQLAAAFNAAMSDEDAALADAPQRTTARRIDQATAARDPQLSWQVMDSLSTDDDREKSTVTTD
jgi:glycine dehydrogenase subunit 2